MLLYNKIQNFWLILIYTPLDLKSNNINYVIWVKFKEYSCDNFRTCLIDILLFYIYFGKYLVATYTGIWIVNLSNSES